MILKINFTYIQANSKDYGTLRKTKLQYVKIVNLDIFVLITEYPFLIKKPKIIII